MTKDLIMKLRERKLGSLTSSSFVQAITPQEEIRRMMNNRHLDVVNTSEDSSLLVFRPDGQCILSIQSDGNAHIWDWESGSHMKTLACGEGAVDAIWCEKDVIVTCAANGGIYRTCVSSHLTTEIFKHASATALAQSQEYNHLVFSCGLDGSVYQIDSRAKNADELMSQKKKWNSIASDPTCFQIALGSENDNRVKLYDIRKFQCELQAPDLSMHDHNLTKVTGLTYSAAGDLLVTYPSCIQMVPKGQSKGYPYGSDLYENNNPVMLTKAYFLGLTHRYIVCGVKGGYCIIWDNKESSGFNFAKVLNTQGAIRCIMPHPRSLALATTGSNQVVKVWEPSAHLVSRDAEVELDLALLDIIDVDDGETDEDDEDDDDDGDGENVENNDEDDNEDPDDDEENNEDPDDDDGDDDGDAGGNIDDGNGGDNNAPSEHGHTRASGSGYDTDEGPVRKKQRLMEGECSSRKELCKSSGIVSESLDLDETASPARDEDVDSNGSGDDEDDEDDDGDGENEEEDDENDDEDPDDDKDKDGDSSTGDDDGDGSGGNANDGNGDNNSGSSEHQPARESGSGSEIDGPVRKKQKLMEGKCSSQKELCKSSGVMPGSFDLSETTSHSEKAFEFTDEIVGSEINVDIIEISQQGVILGSKKKRQDARWGTKEEPLLSLSGLPEMQMEGVYPLYRQERMTCEQTSGLSYSDYSKKMFICFLFSPLRSQACRT